MLTLLVAVAAGTVLATVAGARRGGNALDRFLRGTAGPRPPRPPCSRPTSPSSPSGSTPCGTSSHDCRVSTSRRRCRWRSSPTRGTQYDFGIVASPDGAYFRDVDRPIIVDGRLPSLDAVDEIAVNETAADADRPGCRRRVQRTDLRPCRDRRVPRRRHDHRRRQRADRLGHRRRRGPDGRRAVDPPADGQPWRHRLTRLLPGPCRPGRLRGDPVRVPRRSRRSSTSTMSSTPSARTSARSGRRSSKGIDDEYAGEARSAYRSLASGLLVFAAVAGVVGLLAVLQAVRRHVALGAEADRILGVLGMTRRQRAWAIGGPCAMAAAAGIMGGPVVRWRCRPCSRCRWRGGPRSRVASTPTSSCWRRGQRSSPWPASRPSRGARRRTVSRRPLAASGQWAARVGLAVRWAGPAGSVGVTTALDPGAGPRGVPSRSALLGSVLGRRRRRGGRVRAERRRRPR